MEQHTEALDSKLRERVMRQFAFTRDFNGRNGSVRTQRGCVTIVGSVANMIVLELSRDRAEIGFVEYLKAGVPVTLATTAAGFLMLYLFHAATWV